MCMSEKFVVFQEPPKQGAAINQRSDAVKAIKAINSGERFITSSLDLWLREMEPFVLLAFP